ncbi:MAG TPA: serine/threonine-protein kinase [Aggregatilineales bacterium]|nr:serine/threonine-protein kinase [Aggregatilineales bacterium]
MLQIGDQFDHYQIGGLLAQGGMGHIYHAVDLLNGQEVVIKIPHPGLDNVALERFQREIEITNSLRHPAVQRGIGTGRFNGQPYLVTDYVPGESLRQKLERGPLLPIETTFKLIRAIADGMAYCHEHGVIHRDLKPENLLILEDGQPVIIDFGLALTPNANRVTYANTNPGTPDYMAPEQIEGSRGDARTDLYAIGTIFYEMLTGKPPYSGDTMAAVMAQHLNGTPPRADAARPGVSPALSAIIIRCLRRQPDDRYPTVRALIEALDHPEKVDLAILSNEANRQPWWKKIISTGQK